MVTVMEAAAVAKNEASRVQKKVAELLDTEQGILRFSPLSREKVAALVEVAARLPDSVQGTRALTDIVRLSIAFSELGHADAAKDLQTILRASPAALKRLMNVREQDKATFKQFEAFSGAAEQSGAPHVGAQSPSTGISLDALLPPGAGRRLDRAQRAAAKQQAIQGGASTAEAPTKQATSPKKTRRDFDVR